MVYIYIGKKVNGGYKTLVHTAKSSGEIQLSLSATLTQGKLHSTKQLFKQYKNPL